ncbi:MAG: type 1 glutamine amidotransferase domain-containing protein [Pseudomonas sp.]|uniref:type 1 glutamine amidotransferase domain-containing protein n=1 Tax=Pseudomonas sp. TaxID=306 RepID=UPI0033922504
MILLLLPDSDYDPTESAVPWDALQRAGLDVRFATPTGAPAYADPRLVSGGFGVLNPFFMTKKADLHLYQRMIQSAAFLKPLTYAEAVAADFEALLVPGGHAQGVRSLLESERAQALVVAFFQAGKPTAAVCHGMLLLARAIDPRTGQSVLHGRQATALPGLSMELLAWAVTAPWLGRYYRTYGQTVEAEVRAALATPTDFKTGPRLPRRDSAKDVRAGFTVRDGNLLSARWPGDCHRFAAEFLAMIMATRQATAADRLA